jgi:Na+/H+ antiporter NhaB
MNGFLIISLESGMLLHSEEYQLNFGLSSKMEPLQLSSILYALYSLAHELGESKDEVEDTDVEMDGVVTNIGKSPIDSFRQVRNSLIYCLKMKYLTG